MTTFPGSPKLPKGAIVAVDSTTSRIVSTIAFQYNPETLSRSLQPQVAEGENAAQAEALRLEGAPVETIKVDAEFDATDRLETADSITLGLGIYPQLAALETLIYPKSSQVVANMQRATMGMLEIIPMEAPMTLFVWGKNRILPVRLTEFSIAEEAYDVNLNPIRAKVSLGMRVLNYSDLPWQGRGAKLFLKHHQMKEQMARQGSIRNPAAVTGVNL